MTRSSESLANIFEAFVTFQGEIENISQDRDVEVPIKDKANPGQYKGKYRFRYATMAGTLNQLREALVRNGLWYSQRCERGVTITRIIHKSGEWFETGDLPMPDIKGSPQDVGSIISYFRRYSLNAALGLASEEDAEENQADGGREVDFRAHADAQQAAKSEIEEPPQGFGDWARGLITMVGEKASDKELDELRDANKKYINSVAKVDKSMYADIQATFKNRRAIVNDDVPF